MTPVARVEAFLEAWDKVGYPDAIYGLGVIPDEDEPRVLLVSDLRKILLSINSVARVVELKLPNTYEAWMAEKAEKATREE